MKNLIVLLGLFLGANIMSGYAQEINTLLHGYPVTDLLYTPDGKYIISSGGTELKIWNSTTGELLKTLTGHNGVIADISCSPDSKFIVSGSNDGTVKCWNIETGEWTNIPISKNKEDKLGYITAVEYSPSGKYIGIASLGGIIRLWSTIKEEYVNFTYYLFGSHTSGNVTTDHFQRPYRMSGTGKEEICPINTYTLSISFTSDEKILNCAMYGYLFEGYYLYDIQKGAYDTPSLRFNMSSNVPTQFEYSFDGTLMGLGDGDKKVLIWDIINKKYLWKLKGHNKYVFKVIFSPNGKYAASGSDDKTVKIWDISTGTCIKTVTQGNAVTSLDYSTDGKFIASADGNNIKIWATEDTN